MLFSDRVKRVLKISGIVLGALLLLLWLLVTFFLPRVILAQAEAFAEQTGYRIDIGGVDVSPWQLRVRLNEVRLAPVQRAATQPGDDLLTLKQLDVDARFLPLLIGRVSLEQVTLTSPTVWLAREGRGAAWNWLAFFNRIKRLSTEQPPTDPEKHSTVRVSLESLSVTDGRVTVRDRANGGHTTYGLGPFSLQLSDLTNQDATGHVGGSSLQSKYLFNLGTVHVPLPKQAGMPERQLVLPKLMASGEWREDAEANLHAVLDLSLGEGTIQSTWTLTGGGALNGKLAFTRLAIQPWLALVPSYQTLDSPSGTLSGALELTQDAKALVIDGDARLDQLDIRTREPDHGDAPLLAWQSTSLNRLHWVLPRTAGQAASLTLDEVVVDQPQIRLVIDAQHQSNFRTLLSPPASTPVSTTVSTSAAPMSGDAAPSGTAPPVAASSPAAPALSYDIRSVRLKDGRMAFADESIRPNFRVDVTDLNGSLQGLSNAPGRYATLVLNGRAARTGSLRARGQLAFADPRLNHDVTLAFKNIPLDATNPYAMTFAGYRIDDGRIDADLRYVTKDGQLQGKNRFVIRKIRLGDEVPDYQGTRLPLGLAIALLEDADGMIDVAIPVQGNVNEPEFSVGHLVWQAVRTVLSNVVTAPFRALGTLLGIENIDAMGFVAGESALPPDSDEPLAKIATSLAKRPNSKIVIHGTYDPAVDSAELARAMADQAILAAAGVPVSAGEPLPLPNFSEPRVKAALKSVYGSQVGRIKLGQRLLTLPDTAERDAQLRQELIASYSMTEVQLRQLASQRAETVRARLVSGDAGLAGRISIGEPEAVSADGSLVPIQIELMRGS